MSVGATCRHESKRQMNMDQALSDRPMTMAEKSVVFTMLRENHCTDDEILSVLSLTNARKIRALVVMINRAEKVRAEAVRIAIEEALR